MESSAPRPQPRRALDVLVTGGILGCVAALAFRIFVLEERVATLERRVPVHPRPVKDEEEEEEEDGDEEDVVLEEEAQTEEADSASESPPTTTKQDTEPE